MARKPPYAASRAQEREYYRQLRKVARHVGQLTEMYQDGATLRPGYQRAIVAYAEQLGPWAEAVAAFMLGNVSRTNANAWREASKEIGRQLRAAPQLPTALALQAEQVSLITSLPIDAAARAQKLAMEAATGGKRADEVAREIGRTGEVTDSRAMLIARTEVARSNALINQARSESVGSTHYIWRTAEDSDVRSSHAQMEGVVVAWAEPPTLDDGTTTHAGQIYNCRCFAEPIIN